MTPPFDAVLVPGGGILDGTTPTPWVQKRLDKALEVAGDSVIITLSAGTTHKAPLLDEKGYPLFESVVSARYLVQQGYHPEKILLEHHSYDTIGNAYFARTIHTDPRGFRKLAVVTSRFHMKRTKLIFDWIFTLPPHCEEYSLSYFATENVGMHDEELESRIKGENKRVTSLEKIKPAIDSLSSLHHWLFTQHAAYAVSGSPVPTTEKELGTY